MNKATINFEMGTISPRNKNFDHHSAITHSNAFVAKMSSAQLIEWYMTTGQTAQLDIQFNHHGHIDDLVALAFVSIINSCKKELIYRLYAFALRVSILDSCGPCGNALISKDDADVIDEALNGYHHELKNLGVNARTASLEVKRAAMEKAAKFLIRHIEYTTKVVTMAETKLVDLPSDAKTIDKEVNGLNVRLVEVGDNNPFQYAAGQYADGVDVLIASTTPGKYSIMASSPYTTDLSGLWKRLSALEPEGSTWGGHSGAGGSPRQAESTLTPEKVFKEVLDFLG